VSKRSINRDHNSGASLPEDRRRPTEIVAYVAERTNAKFRPETGETMSDAVERSICYMLSNFTENISLDDMASAVGLSKYHFIRKFRREIGMTPGLFLQHYRITQAMERLAGSDDFIANIAGQVSYSDAAAFSRAFFKITGIQPRCFRRDLRRAAGACGDNG